MGSRVGDAFSSLRTRNYRLFFAGQLVSVSGTWMQTVAQSFLVLHLTGSGTDLGLTTGARFAPIFLFGSWGGLVADRVDKRRLLILTQAVSALLALVFGILVGTGVIKVWIVFVLAAALGLVNAVDLPARQTIISELVAVAQLRNAVTLNSLTVNMARLLGAGLGGGVAAAVGLALCFDLNAASFAAVIVSLTLMNTDEIVHSTRGSREPGQIRAGLRYVRETPAVLVPLLMIMVIGALAWEFEVSLPLVAHGVFGGGAGLFGLLIAIMSAGGVVGGLLTASRPVAGSSSIAKAAVGWGLAITAAALAPNLWCEFAALLLVGYGSITFNSLAKTSLQLAAPPELRGRVMALWALAWQGTTPIGGPLVGWVSEQLGPRWSLLIGGLPTIAVGLLAWPALRAIDRGRRSQVTAAPTHDVADATDAASVPMGLEEFSKTVGSRHRGRP